MAGETLGTIRGQLVLDVRQALTAYTQARQAHVATVVALHTGAGAMIASGAGIAAVGTAMVAGFTAAIGAAAEFEKRLDFFGAVSASTVQEMEEVRQKALELGADTIFSANQIAESFVELGKSGVSARDIINGIGEGVASLGAAADIPLDTAANIITSAVATFQLGAENAVMVADRLAGAANASIVDVQDLGVSLKYVGGVAASLKVPFEDVNTALAILGENGIKGSTAGTSLRQILLGLSGSTDKARTALEGLGIITEDGGNKFFTAEGKAKSLAEVFQILQDATAGMTDQQRTATMQQIFATRALPSLIALTREGAEGFAAMAEEINKTTALEVASKRLDNLSGDLEILRGNIDTLLISSGSGFQGFARIVVQGVTDIVQAFLNLPPGIQTFITGIIAVTGGLAIIVGTAGILAGSLLNIIALAQVMGPVLQALGTAWLAIRLAMLGVAAATAANPLGAILTIIGIIIGALITLYASSEAFRAAVQPLFDALMSVFAAIQPLIITVAGALAQFFSTMATGAAGGLAQVVGFLSQLASTLGGVLSSALAVILPPIMELVGILVAGFMPVLQAIIPLISTVGQILTAVFGGNLAAVSGLITQFGSQFTAVISAIATSLIPAIIQVATTIITTLIGLLPQLVQIGVQIFTTLIQAAATALPMIVGVAVQLITTLITTIIGMIPMLITTGLQLILSLIQALVTMLPMIIQAGITLITGLLQGIVTIIPMLITTIVQIIPILIQAIVTAIPLLITAAIQLFLGLILGLAQALPQIITALIDAVIQIVESLVGLIPVIIDAAIQLFLGLVLGLAQALPQIITAVVEAIPQIITALVGMIPLIIEAAIQLFLGLVTGLAEALPQIITAVIAAIPQIVQAFIDAVPLLVDAGIQLIQGLIDGIVSMGGALWDAAMGVAQEAFNAVKSFFGIASPSKLMHKQGIFWGQGLTGGIIDSIRPVVSAAVMLSEALAAVPFALNMADMYDQLATAQNMTAGLNTQMAGVEASQVFALSDIMEEGTGDTNINVEINNPEPEPASDSLPRSIRKIAYVQGK